MSIASPGADAPTGMLVDALGGAAALSAAAIEKTVATGWRRHPGWGTDPSKAEHVADFTSTLELDLSAPATGFVPARPTSSRLTWTSPRWATEAGARDRRGLHVRPPAGRHGHTVLARSRPAASPRPYVAAAARAQAHRRRGRRDRRARTRRGRPGHHHPHAARVRPPPGAPADGCGTGPLDRRGGHGGALASRECPRPGVL